MSLFMHSRMAWQGSLCVGGHHHYERSCPVVFVLTVLHFIYSCHFLRQLAEAFLHMLGGCYAGRHWPPRNSTYRGFVPGWILLRVLWGLIQNMSFPNILPRPISSISYIQPHPLPASSISIHLKCPRSVIKKGDFGWAQALLLFLHYHKDSQFGQGVLCICSVARERPLPFSVSCLHNSTTQNTMASHPLAQELKAPNPVYLETIGEECW